MAETKPFASLSSGLLARKGAAKPAMRPQGFGSFGSSLEDLGWNDMGHAPGALHDISEAHELPEHVPSSIEALTPAPGGRSHSEPPAVVEQQRELQARLNPVDPEPEAQAEAEAEAEAEAQAQAQAEPAPEPEPQLEAEAQPAPESRVVKLPSVRRKAAPRAPAAAVRAKAAFTLRLDPERHLKLRLACALTRRSAQQLVTEALDDFLDSRPELEALAGHVPEPAKSALSGVGRMNKSVALKFAVSALAIGTTMVACVPGRLADRLGLGQGAERRAAGRLALRQGAGIGAERRICARARLRRARRRAQPARRRLPDDPRRSLSEERPLPVRRDQFRGRPAARSGQCPGLVQHRFGPDRARPAGRSDRRARPARRDRLSGRHRPRLRFGRRPQPGDRPARARRPRAGRHRPRCARTSLSPTPSPATGRKPATSPPRTSLPAISGPGFSNGRRSPSPAEERPGSPLCSE